MSNRFIGVIIALTLAGAACSLPVSADAPTDPQPVLTAAAATVAAELTRNATSGGPDSPTGTATGTPPAATTAAPATAVPSATIPPLPCNAASFVNDVTYPDGSHLLPGQAFTKTWRLRNTGTCEWTSGYQLVFDHGDGMGGPASKQLTTGTAAPGATLDISVDLVAPASNGNYKGFWRLRDPGGVLFGVSTGAFWVDVKVVTPSPTPTIGIILPPPAIALSADLPMIGGQSGAALSDGSTLAFPNVGDVNSNAISQGFISFDMSPIPAGATVIEVKIDFNHYDTLGNPFGGLGCLRVYAHDYGSLNAGDYFSGAPLSSLERWCDGGELSSIVVEDSFKSVVQGKVGSSRVQFRLQFKDTPTDGDGVADMVRFGAGTKLIVKYSP